MSKLVKISDLFTVTYGVNLELVNLDQCKSTDQNAIPFVSRSEYNNGVAAYVKKIETIIPNPAHTISVAGGGSVLSSFYQPVPYYSGRDLYFLAPISEMNVMEMLFYAYCIELNKYKYNYGRQANRTLKDILIPENMPSDFRGVEKGVATSLNNISSNILSIENKSGVQNHNTDKGLTDDELIDKYETGEKVNFDKAIKKMAKSPSPTTLSKQKK